jgi:hypothetical protein
MQLFLVIGTVSHRKTICTRIFFFGLVERSNLILIGSAVFPLSRNDWFGRVDTEKLGEG